MASQPPKGTPAPGFKLTPQQLAVAGTLVAFVAGILASRGLISRETADYLASPETLTVLGGLVATAVAVWQLIQGRPHAIIKATADLPQVDAVITKPKTAGEIPVANVVGSLPEAAGLPGLKP